MMSSIRFIGGLWSWRSGWWRWRIVLNGRASLLSRLGKLEGPNGESDLMKIVLSCIIVVVLADGLSELSNRADKLTVFLRHIQRGARCFAGPNTAERFKHCSVLNVEANQFIPEGVLWVIDTSELESSLKNCFVGLTNGETS